MDFCKYVDGITFLKLYKTYVLPILESNLICWVPNKTQLNRIEKVQKMITKFICKKLKFNNVKYKYRLRLLSLRTLKDRREIKLLKIVHLALVKCEKIPSKWFDYFELVETRNGLMIKDKFTRIKFCDRNIFHEAIVIFGNLPIDIRNNCKEKSFLKIVNEFYDLKHFND